MIFKDRADAGKRLANDILKDKALLAVKEKRIVLSLVRGGAVVGHEIAEKLKIPHYPLIVKKIGAPHNEELAIGAICNGLAYLDADLINRLSLRESDINKQTKLAKQKQRQYQRRFKTGPRTLKGKIVFLVDDGVATGSSVKTALLCLKKNHVKKIILAVPVAPSDFDTSSFYKVFVLHKELVFNAVSQFYEEFPQITDNEIMRYF